MNKPILLSPFWQLIFGIACWLLMPGVAAASEHAARFDATTPVPSLAEALCPDGTLRPGASGSFDARQFRMFTAPNGRPFFRPESTTGAGDAAWQPDFAAAGPNSGVRTVVQVGTDLYVSGAFSTVGSIVARNIAKWNGTSWSSLGMGAANGVNGNVYALAVAGTDVYVAGRFSQAGGVPANSIAKWSSTGWSNVGTGLSNAGSTQPATVKALAVSGTAVYAGGTFNQAGGSPANNVALWDGTGWNPLGSGVSGTSPSVEAIAVSGTGVYVGGGFNNAGGTTVSNIARWNGTTWSNLGTGIGNSTNGVVLTLLSYVGGAFTLAGGLTVDCLAKWNSTGWSRVGGAGFANGRSNGAVTSLAFVGSDLYVGGYFAQAYGAVADYLAKWNGTTWQGVGTGLGGLREAGSSVSGLLAVGTDLYVAGRFLSAGGSRADNIARWNGTAWNSLGPNAPNTLGFDSYVYALGIAGNTMYVGGAFRQAGGAAVEGIVRWNGSSWTSLHTGTNYADMRVQTIAISGSDVYVGGSFFNANSVTANNVAKWNGTTWSSLGTGTENGVDGTVYALAVSGSDVYVGGSFTQAGTTPASCIAKWNGAAWTSLGTGSANGVSHPSYSVVQALAVMGTDIYVGGQFNRAGALTVGNLARWNGTTWSSIGTGTNGTVYALAASGSGLYVGGGFSQIGGVAAKSIALWNGTGWSSLGTGTANGVTGFIQALAVVGTDVYVGGRLTQAGGAPVLNLAKWNGTAWSGLGTGANNTVSALAISGGRVYAGGTFTAVGDESKVMNYFGIYDPALATGVTAASASARVNLYPNPAQGQVTFTLIPSAEVRTIYLLDSQGKVRQKVMLPANSGAATIPLSGLATGVYLLRCGLISRRLAVL
jgi:hypothetical protein